MKDPTDEAMTPKANDQSNATQPAPKPEAEVQISRDDMVAKFDNGPIQYIYDRGHTIVLGISYDWSPQTCWLTGRRFWPPAPLGFFYKADPHKPVDPLIAMRRGFSIDELVLYGLCEVLNGRAPLVGLPLAMAFSHRWDDVWFDAHGQGTDEPSWINNYFRMSPQVIPTDIGAEVAYERATINAALNEITAGVSRDDREQAATSSVEEQTQVVSLAELHKLTEEALNLVSSRGTSRESHVLERIKAGLAALIQKSSPPEEKHASPHAAT